MKRIDPGSGRLLAQPIGTKGTAAPDATDFPPTTHGSLRVVPSGGSPHSHSCEISPGAEQPSFIRLIRLIRIYLRAVLVRRRRY